MPPVADATPAGGGVPRPLATALAVVAAQAVALLVAAAIVLFKIATGNPHSVAGALFLAGWAVVGAVILGLGARSMLRLRPPARTPVVVVELFALPVSYTLAFSAHRPAYGAPILISALVVLYLLFVPASRAALDRDR